VRADAAVACEWTAPPALHRVHGLERSRGDVRGCTARCHDRCARRGEALIDHACGSVLDLGGSLRLGAGRLASVSTGAERSSVEVRGEASAKATAEDAERARVVLELEEGYRFKADLGHGTRELVFDEPPPIGEGAGPNASALLAAGVGNCLSASLLYCLRRARVQVRGLRTEVEVVPQRNDAGRLRIGSVRVRMVPVIDAADRARFERCLEIFEDFCVVTASVRQGVDVEVAVDPRS
jgi:uncharacterized OsmC-like protein